MPDFHSAVVPVQREWNAWRTAEVSVDDLEDVHWAQPIGAPHPLLHGYVSCARLAGGQIPHDCARTPGPHRVLVCVLKRHLMPSVYLEIERRANAAAANDHPAARMSRTARAVAPPMRA